MTTETQFDLQAAIDETYNDYKKRLAAQKQAEEERTREKEEKARSLFCSYLDAALPLQVQKALDLKIKLNGFERNPYAEFTYLNVTFSLYYIACSTGDWLLKRSDTAEESYCKNKDLQYGLLVELGALQERIKNSEPVDYPFQNNSHLSPNYEGIDRV